MDVKEEFATVEEKGHNTRNGLARAEASGYAERLENRNNEALLKCTTTAGLYSCELCIAALPSIDELYAHYRNNHIRKVNHQSQKPQSKTSSFNRKHCCPHCDYKSNLVGHLKRHILIHTGETPFECPHCDFKCRDKTVLKRHLNRHFRDGPGPKSRADLPKVKLHCNQCSFATSFRGALSRHVLRHKDPIRCQHCGQRYWKEESYANHILLHNGIALHSCEFCDYKSNVSGDLRNHVRRMHPVSKSWFCSDCNYVSSCPSDLSKHRIIHKTDRPYSCDTCGYTCKRRSHLLSHESIHDRKLKNYCCPFCSFRTNQIASLKIHVRSHTGEKPYKCDSCELAFTSQGGLRSHTFTHLKSWSQSCPHCAFTASKPRLFKAHIDSHMMKSTTLKNVEALSPAKCSSPTSEVCFSEESNEMTGHKAGDVKEENLFDSYEPAFFPEDDNLTFLEEPTHTDDLDDFHKLDLKPLSPALLEVYDHNLDIEDIEITSTVLVKQEIVTSTPLE